MEQIPPKPYEQLKQKQKAKVSDYMYLETLAFWQMNQRMPSTDSEMQAVTQKVYDHIASFHVAYEEVYAVYLKIECLQADGLPGHIRSHAEIKELQRVCAAKKAGKPRKKRAKKLWNQRCLNRMIPSFSLQAIPLAVRPMVLLGKKWGWSPGTIQNTGLSQIYTEWDSIFQFM